MISLYGIDFPDFENEKITNNTILTCHPQRVAEERFGVPLRLTAGYQCFYDKLHRLFVGLTFYAPVNAQGVEDKDKLNPSDKPHQQFSYVLASFDGKLTMVNGELVLSDGSKALIYSHFSPTKTSGNVKKGAIIGNVSKVPGGLGYGVSIRGYKGGKIWDLQRDIINIRCLE